MHQIIQAQLATDVGRGRYSYYSKLAQIALYSNSNYIDKMYKKYVCKCKVTDLVPKYTILTDLELTVSKCQVTSWSKENDPSG